MESLLVFLGGTLFGSVGFKALKSRQAKKVYTEITAAGLRVKDCAEKTAQSVKEEADDILADAKELNEKRDAEAAAEEAEKAKKAVVEDVVVEAE